jgi:hypothetical protein
VDAADRKVTLRDLGKVSDKTIQRIELQLIKDKIEADKKKQELLLASQTDAYSRGEHYKQVELLIPTWGNSGYKESFDSFKNYQKSFRGNLYNKK